MYVFLVKGIYGVAVFRIFCLLFTSEQPVLRIKQIRIINEIVRLIYKWHSLIELYNIFNEKIVILRITSEIFLATLLLDIRHLSCTQYSMILL